MVRSLVILKSTLMPTYYIRNSLKIKRFVYKNFDFTQTVRKDVVSFIIIYPYNKCRKLSSAT